MGHLGTPELGGLAVAAALLITGSSLFIFLTYGTTGVIARLVGAGDRERAAHEGIQSVWLGLALGIAIALAGAALSEPLIDAMGAEGEVRAHALTYFRISLLGLPALLVSMSGTGYLRGLHDARTPLFVTIGANLANLVMEVVLIFGLGYGIGASALSTVVAQTAGAFVYIAIVARGVRRAGVPVVPNFASIRRLLRFGFDLFLRTASLRVVFLLAVAVAARLGTLEVAANQIALELWNTLAFMLDAVAIAGQAIVPRLLGAGAADEARAVGRRMIRWGVATGIILGILVAVFRWPIASIFSNDDQVVALAAYLLLFGAAFQPIAGIAFVLDGLLIGAGDQRYLAVAMFVSAAAFLPGAFAVLAFDLGVGALWLSIGTFMFVRAATLLYRFATPHWQVVGAPA